jgi:hypothetical protein
MKGLGIGLLIAAGVLLLVIGTAGTVFYLKIYRPVGAPIAALGIAKKVEDLRLQNRTEFLPPISGELTEAQTANFAAVEGRVQEQLATRNAVLAQTQADLERANEANVLSVPTTLLAFGDVQGFYVDAKKAQVDAMNRANFSKEEFEWVRKQLYHAAGLRLSQLDVSEILAGVRDATVQVHRFEQGGPVPERNQRLARPLASKLQAWGALAFFGL